MPDLREVGRWPCKGVVAASRKNVRSLSGVAASRQRGFKCDRQHCAFAAWRLRVEFQPPDSGFKLCLGKKAPVAGSSVAGSS